MGKDVNKRKSIRRAKFLTELIISAVILGLGGYAIKTSLDRVTDVGSSPYVETTIAVQEITEPVIEAPDPNKIIYENISVVTKDKFKGDLILVNVDHQYFGGNEELVSINEKLDADGRETYRAYDNTAQILSKVYTPLSKLLDDFNAATGYDDVLIEGAFRTNERQQELYDNDLAATGNTTSDRVALPGHSEHECGYAVDFGINAEGVEYDGTGEYDWIDKNCWKYGFILRYAEEKTDITQIKYEPWHYRYVGVPHAYYMYTNDICLEEYIELLRDYTYESEHLKFSDENGTEYEIYFVPSDDGAETTLVPVPSDLKYEISGNNADGFIVTVYPGEKMVNTSFQMSTEAPTTEAEETSESGESEDTSDESSDGEASDDSSEESSDEE
ncbi:MAG: M15 family metallopeptidase [Ruminococcus sp.]|nr:M15 family metallopeptidase [Ruminococcus sp.]